MKRDLCKEVSLFSFNVIILYIDIKLKIQGEILFKEFLGLKKKNGSHDSFNLQEKKNSTQNFSKT